ncbi:hypothetical protein E3T28_15900 [Cryobacterium sinapicolor]|uniref:Uncharacterized protein n=1 Tax=Cryobacterium sinapicolor TaxID=1259236 RepID=A0ABY2IT35_9MICO|nr:hypothetical protein [Cryobacterium sinapicolor]TFC94038.1 hypothetical protein E3T28_15900 [Cryobacterium sinapicolor]
MTDTGAPTDDAPAESSDRTWDAPCEFEGCTRRYHDPLQTRAEWRHEVYVAADFDGGTVEAALSVFSDGRPPVGDIHAGADGDLMTAAEFRKAADNYEAFPAWLRSLADRLDGLEQ